MRLISFRAAGWTLVRLISANAVRIALAATLTSPQAAIARGVPTIFADSPASADMHPCVVGPGFGCG